MISSKQDLKKSNWSPWDCTSLSSFSCRNRSLGRYRSMLIFSFLLSSEGAGISILPDSLRQQYMQLWCPSYWANSSKPLSWENLSSNSKLSFWLPSWEQTISNIGLEPSSSSLSPGLKFELYSSSSLFNFSFFAWRLFVYFAFPKLTLHGNPFRSTFMKS